MPKQRLCIFGLYGAIQMLLLLLLLFWPIIDSSSLYVTRVIRGQGAVLRRIGGRGHFRLRRKDGGQTIRSAIAENSPLYANCTVLSFIETQLLPVEVLHCGNREFRVFLRKIVENIKIFRSCRKDYADDAEAHFLPIIDSSNCYATRVTRDQGAVLGLRRIGVRGHFRSRDKDGGHTCTYHSIRHCQNPLLYANSTALSSIEPELLLIEVLHCDNRKFHVCVRKIVKNIKNFCSHPKKDVDVAETRLLSHKTRQSVKRCDLYRCARNKKK